MSGGIICEYFAVARRLHTSLCPNTSPFQELQFCTSLSFGNPRGRCSACSRSPGLVDDTAQPNRYIAAHGIRGFAGGYSEDGLEVWTFPLQLVNGYRLSFVLPKAAPVSAITILTSVEVDPLGVTRIYTAPDFRVRERIATHAEEPGVFVRFSVEIVVTFTFRFNFSHPST